MSVIVEKRLDLRNESLQTTNIYNSYHLSVEFHRETSHWIYTVN